MVTPDIFDRHILENEVESIFHAINDKHMYIFYRFRLEVLVLVVTQQTGLSMWIGCCPVSSIVPQVGATRASTMCVHNSLMKFER